MKEQTMVNVKCDQFISMDEFDKRMKEYGITNGDCSVFSEREGCVFCCEAEQNGVKGMALFF